MDVHHRFTLVYSGLAAAENHMPVALKNDIGEGMQWFVGAPLWYVAHGSVPPKIPTRTPFYAFADFRGATQSWTVEMDVSTSVAIIGDGYLLRDVAKDLSGDALKVTVNRAFRQFIKASYDATMRRQLVEYAPRERMEPFLKTPGNNLAAEASEQLAQKQRLYQRMNGALANITAPLRKAAEGVDLWFDGAHLGHFDRRIYCDDQIENAIYNLMKDDGMWPPKPPQ